MPNPLTKQWKPYRKFENAEEKDHFLFCSRMKSSQLMVNDDGGGVQNTVSMTINSRVFIYLASVPCSCISSSNAVFYD